MENRSVRELAFLFIDKEMDAESLVAFRRRIQTCPECARETQYAEYFLTVVRSKCRRQPAPRQLRRRILDTLPSRGTPR